MPVVQPQFDFTRIDRRTKRITPALIAAIRDRIVQGLRPKRIILFGSQATGNTRNGSDVDLLVVLDDNHPLAQKKRRDRLGELFELFRYRSFGMDAMVLTDAEIRRIIDENEGEWDLVLEIIESGRTLYERVETEKVERARSTTHQRMVP